VKKRNFQTCASEQKRREHLKLGAISRPFLITEKHIPKHCFHPPSENWQTHNVGNTSPTSQRTSYSNHVLQAPQKVGSFSTAANPTQINLPDPERPLRGGATIQLARSLLPFSFFLFFSFFLGWRGWIPPADCGQPNRFLPISFLFLSPQTFLGPRGTQSTLVCLLGSVSSYKALIMATISGIHKWGFGFAYVFSQCGARLT